MMAMSCLARLGSPLYVVYASPLSFSVFRFFLTHSLSNRSRFRPFLRVLVSSSAILETDSGHVTMPRVGCLLRLRKFLFNMHLQFSVCRSIVEVCKCLKQVQSHFQHVAGYPLFALRSSIIPVVMHQTTSLFNQMIMKC